jgi:hypothetical protein
MAHMSRHSERHVEPFQPFHPYIRRFSHPNIILGVIALVEGIIYLTKTDEEFEQIYVVGKKQWF